MLGYIGIKRHADTADQQSTGGRDLNPLGCQADQAIVAELLQFSLFGVEIVGKADIEALFQCRNVQLELADQLGNDGAANMVVTAESDPALDRMLLLSNRLAVGGNVVFVLVIHIADLADGGYAHGDQVAIGVGGIALEVAMQLALCLRQRQLIIGFGKVIHADVDIARLQQTVDGVLQDIELGFGAWQIVSLNMLLRAEAIWQMGIVEHGETIGAHADHGIQRVGKAVFRLMWQAIDQVHIDRFEPQGTGLLKHPGGHLGGLDTVYRFLHTGINILYAEADTVEADLAQYRQGCIARLARIDLDRVVTPVVITQVEVRSQCLHQLAHLIVTDEGRRAATPVQLVHLAVTTVPLRQSGHLVINRVQIGLGFLAVAGDDLVAGTVVADMGAKGNVHIE